jgi:glucose/arabinose dehydrogenase
LASLLTLFSAPSDTAAAQPFEVIASGLDNPRGLAFGPDGALDVVEAGRGSDGPCTPFEQGVFRAIF